MRRVFAVFSGPADDVDGACPSPGRYSKYSRCLSQTPWYVGGGRRTKSSIQEMVTDTIVAHTRASGQLGSAAVLAQCFGWESLIKLSIVASCRGEKWRRHFTLAAGAS